MLCSSSADLLCNHNSHFHDLGVGLRFPIVYTVANLAYQAHGVSNPRRGRCGVSSWTLLRGMAFHWLRRRRCTSLSEESHLISFVTMETASCAHTTKRLLTRPLYHLLRRTVAQTDTLLSVLLDQKLSILKKPVQSSNNPSNPVQPMKKMWLVRQQVIMTRTSVSGIVGLHSPHLCDSHGSLRQAQGKARPRKGDAHQSHANTLEHVTCAALPDLV